MPTFLNAFKPLKSLLLRKNNGFAKAFRWSKSPSVQAKFKEYGFLIPMSLAMTGLKVLMHGKAYQSEGYSQQDQKLLYVQEAVRQTISTVLWLGTLCFSYEYIVKKAFPKLSNMGQVLMSNLISQVPDTFVRPILTAKLSKAFLDDFSSIVSEPIEPQPFVLPYPIKTEPIAVQRPFYSPLPHPSLGPYGGFSGQTLRFPNTFYPRY